MLVVKVPEQRGTGHKESYLVGLWWGGGGARQGATQVFTEGGRAVANLTVLWGGLAVRLPSWGSTCHLATSVLRLLFLLGEERQTQGKLVAGSDATA